MLATPRPSCLIFATPFVINRLLPYYKQLGVHAAVIPQNYASTLARKARRHSTQRQHDIPESTRADRLHSGSIILRSRDTDENKRKRRHPPYGALS